MNRDIQRSLAEEYYLTHGIEYPPLRPTPRVFSVELEGSPLLQAMKRRLDELGWLDEDGKARFAELARVEQMTLPIYEQAGEWLAGVGYPEPDEWDEWDEDTDWRSMRW